MALRGIKRRATEIYKVQDAFGRITDQRWINNASGTNYTPIDRFQYDYDRNGNVPFKNNQGPGTNAASFSELYHANAATNDTGSAYDLLNRLTGFRRGTLSASGYNGGILDTVTTLNSNTNVAGSQSWTLDALGNWSNLTTNGTRQTDTTNRQNELTGVTTGTNTTTVTYDNNGNMKTDDHGNSMSYDAWNRLTYTSSIGVFYEYYGDHRQAAGINGSQYNGGAIFYYDNQWRVIEEWDFNTYNLQRQNVYGVGYVDDMIVRIRFRDTNNASLAIPEKLYVQHDANHNVTSITDTSGVVQDRFIYDSYGKFTTLMDNWSAQSATNVAALDWNYYFQGLRYDADSQTFTARNRDYSPTLGKWLEQDPAGYVDGKNLYEFVSDSPVSRLDPSGLNEPGCDRPAQCLPAALPGLTTCYLRCCGQHDQCYSSHGCTAASWLTSGPWSACFWCNATVTVCFARCALGWAGPNNGLYFCPNGPNRGSWYNTWAAIPGNCFTTGVAPPAPPGWP